MKYTTQFMNLANQNSQATRAQHVGSMNELVAEFRDKKLNPSEWKSFYLKKMGSDCLALASAKIKDKLQEMRDGYDYLLDNLHEVDEWVEDLIFNKTFKGFEIQSEVLSQLAGNKPWRLSTRYEESLGIDGFIDEKPYQVKPHTAKHLASVNQQTIKAEIVYYRKSKGQLIIE
jgi:hypothetical protein